ncbi:MAG: TIR domain-containing protein [Desulfobaccales bacterium]
MIILLVEDDYYYGNLLKEILNDYGIKVNIVKSAEDALREDINHYCSIIIDVMLPNNPDLSGISIEESRGGFLTGVALARNIRKSHENVPIILMSGGMSGDALGWATEQEIPFIYKYDSKDELVNVLRKLEILGELLPPKAFIVHGHDDATVNELKDYLQNTLKWQEPLVLRDQPSCGKTIIEKFEKYSRNVDWVFVILTPDDKVVNYQTDDEKRRARQNVIFELGFFYGMIGRQTGKIIVLKKGEIELPSDIQGIIWIDITNGIKKSGEDIRREVGG